jgi:AcrR family transcriptional regulator
MTFLYRSVLNISDGLQRVKPCNVPLGMKSNSIGVKSNPEKSRLGRPRGFDAQRALDRALAIFWRDGYEGASLPALTKAMGINRPSLYAAFGNKEALFRKALARYDRGPAGYTYKALKKPKAREVVAALLEGIVALLTRPQNPGGCLMVQGALACGENGRRVREELASQRAAGVVAIRRRFQRAIDEGDLPANADASGLARFVATVMHGMAVQAASGASRKELVRVKDMFLRMWPPV